MRACLLTAVLGVTLATFVHGQTPRFLAYNPSGPILIYDFATQESHKIPFRMQRNPSLTSAGQIVAADGPDGILLYRWQRPGRGFIELPGLDQPEFSEYDPALSGTSQFIAYTSLEIDNENVRLYNSVTQERVRLRGINTDAFNEFHPAISADGRWVAFTSDRNGPSDARCENHGGCWSWDVFLYDRQAGTLVDLPGLNGSDTPEHWPSISADGRFIVFATSRDSGPETQEKRSIFLYDRETQTVDGLPALNGPPDRDRPFRNFQPSISDDGRYIAFGGGSGNPSNVFDRLTDSFVAGPKLGESQPWIE